MCLVLAGLYNTMHRESLRSLSTGTNTSYFLLQSSLPIPPFLGLAKNRRYSETVVLGRSLTLKNPIWDLKWVGHWEGGAVLGGRRGIGRAAQYWEGRLYSSTPPPQLALIVTTNTSHFLLQTLLYPLPN